MGYLKINKSLSDTYKRLATQGKKHCHGLSAPKESMAAPKRNGIVDWLGIIGVNFHSKSLEMLLRLQLPQQGFITLSLF